MVATKFASSLHNAGMRDVLGRAVKLRLSVSLSGCTGRVVGDKATLFVGGHGPENAEVS